MLFSQEKKLSCDGKERVGAGTRHPATCPWQRGMKENKGGRITQAAAMLGKGLASELSLAVVGSYLSLQLHKKKVIFPRNYYFSVYPPAGMPGLGAGAYPTLQPLEATMHCCRAGRLLQQCQAFVGSFAMYTTIIGMLCIPPMSPKCRQGSPQQQGLFNSAVGAKWWLQPIRIHPPLAAFIDPK